MVWFTQGNGINVIDFDECEILSNRIFTINPKQIHNWNYSDDCHGYFLLIEEHLAKHLNIDFSLPFVDLKTDDIQSEEKINSEPKVIDETIHCRNWLLSKMRNIKSKIYQQ